MTDPTANTAQRVDVERLTAKWREMARLAACPRAAADILRGCADELEAALPALLLQVAEQAAEIERLADIERRSLEAMGKADDEQGYNSAFWAARTMKHLRDWKARAEAAERAREEAINRLSDFLDKWGTTGLTVGLITNTRAFLAANGGSNA